MDDAGTAGAWSDAKGKEYLDKLHGAGILGTDSETRTNRFDANGRLLFASVARASSSTLLQGGSTTNLYDANNNLIGVRDATKSANNRDYINDAGGHILQAVQNGNAQRQLVVNGEVLGRHGSYLNPDKPADSSGNPLFTSGASFNFGFTKVSGSYAPCLPEAMWTLSLNRQATRRMY